MERLRVDRTYDIAGAERRVLEQAEAELDWQPSLPARSIRVTEVAGTVALTGTVRSYLSKWEAERAIEHVRGVRAIVNEIVVAPSHTPSNEDLAASARRRLAAAPRVPQSGITISTQDGWLVLEGQVDWDYQRRAAADAVRSLPGLRGLTNALTIRTRRGHRKWGEPGLRRQLAAALARDARLDSSRIEVAFEGGHVVLCGSVASITEKREAELRAWSAPGIWSVDNLLTVEPDENHGHASAATTAPQVADGRRRPA